MLFLGSPGTGKSDLVLRLLGRGWRLVSDDQVELTPEGADGLRVTCPAPLRGLLEVRGLGIFAGIPQEETAELRLVIELGPREAVPRLPEPACWSHAGRNVPLIALHAFDCSAPSKVELALAAATARARQTAGAFAAA